MERRLAVKCGGAPPQTGATRAYTGRMHPPAAPAFACRSGCAACCTAPSISSAIPGLPHGKPAGMPCPQLDAALRCRLFGRPERPAVCASLRPSDSMCGASREDALAGLMALERATA